MEFLKSDVKIKLDNFVDKIENDCIDINNIFIQSNKSFGGYDFLYLGEKVLFLSTQDIIRLPLDIRDCFEEDLTDTRYASISSKIVRKLLKIRMIAILKNRLCGTLELILLDKLDWGKLTIEIDEKTWDFRLVYEGRNILIILRKDIGVLGTYLRRLIYAGSKCRVESFLVSFLRQL